MATSTANKVSINVKLNDGVDETGSVKTVGVSLGSLSVSGFDADKALEVVNLLGACLTKTVYTVEKTEVTTLSA